MNLKSYNQLASDLDIDTKSSKLDLSEWDIVEILDVIPDSEKLDIGNLLENVTKSVVSTKIPDKRSKRGDIIWVSCLLQKRYSTAFTSQSVTGVLKLRVTDIRTIHFLKSIKNINQINNTISQPMKRGNLIYVTMNDKSVGNSPSSQYVLVCRIIDVYKGLAYLNKVIKNI